MPDDKLVLHPVNARAILQDPAQLVDGLRKAGLVGAGFSHVGELHYRSGPRFNELVCFRSGTPAAGTCHVSIMETTERPTFLGASNAQPPECPRCRTKIADWRRQLTEWQNEGQRNPWSCPGCAARIAVKDLVWGTTGGIARYSVDLWNVAPEQAAPSPELLALLERETLETWRYFYYRF